MLVSDKEIKIQNILISNINKIGLVHLHGVEKYLTRKDIQKSILIAKHAPHENVILYAKQIPSLEIVISKNFLDEKKKIEQAYPEAKILIIDPYHLAGRDGALDA